MLRPLEIWALALATAACGARKDSEPAAAAQPAKGDRSTPVSAPKLPTELPADRPSPFEAEYRVMDERNNDAVMVKLTEKGLRYSTGDRHHRVVLSFEDDTSLDRIYAALRASSFDRIETRPARSSDRGGTSIRLLAGTLRHSVSDMGRIYPKDEWATEYDAAAKAMESLLPTSPAGEAAGAIQLRWDPTMKDHDASLDLPLGTRFGGIEKVGPTTADVRVHLRATDPIEITLRHGPTTTASTHALDPARHAALLVSFDAEQGIPIARALTAEQLAALTKPDAPAKPPGEGKPSAPGK
jgi:hypothetical protein